MTLHSNLSGSDIHKIARWEHANASARTSEVVTDDDLGKISHQIDTDSFYFLKSQVGGVGTWVPFGDSGAAVSSLIGGTGVNVDSPTGDVTVSITAGATAVLTEFSKVDSSQGVVPGTGGGLDATYYLDASGNWTQPSGGGDVTAASDLTDNTLIRGDVAAKGVQDTNIVISDTDDITGVGNLTISGNIVLSTPGATVDLIDLTALDSSVTNHVGTASIHIDWTTDQTPTYEIDPANIPTFDTASTTPGLVPGSNSEPTHILYGDGNWAPAPTGTGDVASTSNLTDLAITVGDGGAKNIKSTGVIIADTSNDVTGVGNLTLSGNIVLSTPSATVDGIDLTALDSSVTNHTGNNEIHVDWTTDQTPTYEIDPSNVPTFDTASTSPGLVVGSNNVDNTHFLRADNSWQQVSTVDTDNPGIGEFEYLGVVASAADPGPGSWTRNNAVDANVDRIDINYTTQNGFDTESFIANLAAGAHLVMRSNGEDQSYVVNDVTDQLPANTWASIGVSHVDNSTSWTLNTNDVHSVALYAGPTASATIAISHDGTGGGTPTAQFNTGEIVLKGDGATLVNNGGVAEVTVTAGGGTVASVTGGAGLVNDGLTTGSVVIDFAAADDSLTVNTDDVAVNLDTVAASGKLSLSVAGIKVGDSEIDTTQLANNAVSNTKLADMEANTVKVNATDAPADPTNLNIPLNTVLGRAAGNIVAAAVSTNQIATNAVTNTRLAQANSNTIKGNASGVLTNVSDISVGTNTVLGRAAGNIVAAQLVNGQIANSTIANTKLVTVAPYTIKANVGGTTTNPGDLAVGANTVVGRAATGNIVASQVVEGQISDSAVSYAKIQNVVNNNRVLGRVSGAGGIIEELEGTDLVTIIPSFSQIDGTPGLVPGTGGAASTFYLDASGNWSEPPGGVTGPGTHGDNLLIKWDGIDTDTLQSTGITIADTSNNITGAGTYNGVDVPQLETDFTAHDGSTDGHPLAEGQTPGPESAGLMPGSDKTKLDFLSVTGAVDLDNDFAAASHPHGFTDINNVPENTIIGRNDAGIGAAEALNGAEVTALLSPFDPASTTQGVVPGANNVGATFYLDASGNWSEPPGGAVDSIIAGSGIDVDQAVGNVTVSVTAPVSLNDGGVAASSPLQITKTGDSGDYTTTSPGTSITVAALRDGVRVINAATGGLLRIGPNYIEPDTNNQASPNNGLIIGGGVNSPPHETVVTAGTSTGLSEKGGDTFIRGGIAVGSSAEGGDLNLYGGEAINNPGNFGEVIVGGYGSTAASKEIRFLKGFSIEESASVPGTAVSGKGRLWVRTSDKALIYTSPPDAVPASTNYLLHPTIIDWTTNQTPTYEIAPINVPLFETDSTVRGTVPGADSAGASAYLDGSGAWSDPLNGVDIVDLENRVSGSTFEFTYAAASPPAAGLMIEASSTTLEVNYTTSNGVLVASIIESLDPGDHIITGNGAGTRIYVVTGAPVDSTGYYSIPVSTTKFSSPGYSLTAGDTISVNFEFTASESSGLGVTIHDEGASQGAGVTTLDFVGAGVDASVNATTATITIPHTSVANLVSGSLAELNNNISDATLDDASSVRPTTIHDSTVLQGDATIIDFVAPLTASVTTGTATIGVDQSLIDHTSISGIGTNTHVQIDNHIGDTTTNPHNISFTNMNGGTLGELNTLVSGDELVGRDDLASGYSYTIDTTTITPSATAGSVIFDTNDPTTAGFMYIANSTLSGIDIATELNRSGIITFTKKSDFTQSISFVISTYAQQAGYVDFTLASHTVSTNWTGGVSTTFDVYLTDQATPAAAIADLQAGTSVELAAKLTDINAFDGESIGDVVVTVNNGVGQPTFPPALLASVGGITQGNLPLPAAGTAGSLYLAVDAFQLFRDNGVTWDQISMHQGTNAERVALEGSLLAANEGYLFLERDATPNPLLYVWNGSIFEQVGGAGGGSVDVSSSGTPVVTSATEIDFDSKFTVSDQTGGSAGVTIASGAVTTTELGPDAVTNAKIADAQVDSEHIVAGAVDLSHLSASGTSDSTTYLRGDNSWQALPTGTNSTLKSWVVETPTAGDKFAVFTDQALTIQEVQAVLEGSSTPSVTWNIAYGTDRSAAGTDVWAADKVTTSTTTGDNFVTFTNSTIPADNYFWLEIVSVSGTVDQIEVTLIHQALGGSLSVTDGVVTVDPCSAIDFTSGASVIQNGTTAEISISGGGGGAPAHFGIWETRDNTGDAATGQCRPGPATTFGTPSGVSQIRFHPNPKSPHTASMAVFLKGLSSGDHLYAHDAANPDTNWALWRLTDPMVEQSATEYRVNSLSYIASSGTLSDSAMDLQFVVKAGNGLQYYTDSWSGIITLPNNITDHIAWTQATYRNEAMNRNISTTITTSDFGVDTILPQIPKTGVVSNVYFDLYATDGTGGNVGVYIAVQEVTRPTSVTLTNMWQVAWANYALPVNERTLIEPGHAATAMDKGDGLAIAIRRTSATAPTIIHGSIFWTYLIPT